MNIKSIKPLFTKIVTTKYCLKSPETGIIYNSGFGHNNVSPYQRVIAVGTNSAGIQVGDIVCINPVRYAVMRHREGTLKDGVVSDNPVVDYLFREVDINNESALLLDTSDIEYIVSEWEGLLPWEDDNVVVIPPVIV